MTEPGASPLLTCLTKLNDDARAEVLLPKLIKQGSAKAVAATCTQLRDLCFRTVQTVKLADLHLIPDTYSAEDWVAPLPEHFCNCTSLVAVLADEQDTPKLPRMLPGIARLPKLDTLHLCLTTPPMPAALAIMLVSMRAALTGLQGLCMEFTQPWPQSKLVWQEVASFSQLTSLDILFNDKDPVPFNGDDLAPLSKLCNLESLAFTPIGPKGQLPQEDPAAASSGGWLQCLAGMTALTVLQANVFDFGGLEHVGACSNLEALCLGGLSARCVLTDEEWGAVGQLTKLTQIWVHTLGASPAPTACYDALRNLTKMRGVGGVGWTVEALPVFSEMTNLEVIVGSWLPEADAYVADGLHTCRSVQQVIDASGPVPFAAFPNLKAVSHVGTLPLKSVAELQKCHGLAAVRAQLAVVRLGLEPGLGTVSLPPNEPVAARVAALKGFAKLLKLVEFEFKPSDNAELAAFVAAAKELTSQFLRYVKVAIEPDTHITASGLMLLGQLNGLEQLTVSHVYQEPAWLADPAPFMCALSGVRHVHLWLPRTQLMRLDVTIQALKAAELTVPKSMSFTENV